MALIIFANTCNLKVLSHDRQCHGPDLFEYFRQPTWDQPITASLLNSQSVFALMERMFNDLTERWVDGQLNDFYKIHFSGNPHSSKALRIGSFDNLLVSGNYSKERLTWQ